MEKCLSKHYQQPSFKYHIYKNSLLQSYVKGTLDPDDISGGTLKHFDGFRCVFSYQTIITFQIRMG